MCKCGSKHGDRFIEIAGGKSVKLVCGKCGKPVKTITGKSKILKSLVEYPVFDVRYSHVISNMITKEAGQMRELDGRLKHD